MNKKRLFSVQDDQLRLGTNKRSVQRKNIYKNEKNDNLSPEISWVMTSVLFVLIFAQPA